MSLVQAVTQIHEQTVAFVPKLLAVVAALLVLGPFMLGHADRFRAPAVRPAGRGRRAMSAARDRRRMAALLAAPAATSPSASCWCWRAPGAACMLLPGIGEAELPMMMRAGFALALTAVLLPVLRPRPAAAAGRCLARAVHAGGGTGGRAAARLAGAAAAAGAAAGRADARAADRPGERAAAGRRCSGRRAPRWGGCSGWPAPVLLLASGLYALPLQALAGSYRVLPAGRAAAGRRHGGDAWWRRSAPVSRWRCGWPRRSCSPASSGRWRWRRWRGWCRSCRCSSWPPPRSCSAGWLLLAACWAGRCWRSGARRRRAAAAPPCPGTERMAEGAEDRTEAATRPPPARGRARQGQAPLSREAAPLAVLAAATLLLAMLAAPATRGRLTARLARAADAGARAVAGRRRCGWPAMAALLGAAPFALAGALASAAAVLAQTGLLVTPGGAAARPGAAQPAARAWRGCSRPRRSLEAGKAAAQAAAPPARPSGRCCARHCPAAAGVARLDAGGAARPHGARRCCACCWRCWRCRRRSPGFDIVRARRAHAGGLRMSRQELRDEHKETEGNPHISARIRRLRLQRARRRMLDAVPTAAVVVTNPTHYAVALAYQRGAAAAPRVVAKGMDEMAARIREIAARAAACRWSPTRRSPARCMRSSWTAKIPRELYQAVAELIAYVWRLRAGCCDRPAAPPPRPARRRRRRG